jgi:hypothetical protein
MALKVSGTVDTRVKPVTSEITAVVTRADGRVEDLGRIAYWHANPLRNLLGNAMIRLREFVKRVRS